MCASLGENRGSRARRQRSTSRAHRLAAHRRAHHLRSRSPAACLAALHTALYLKVKVDIDISNRNIDFVEQAHDLAIRLDEPRDSRLVARRLEAATLGVFASPSYLKQRDTPKALTDLRQHDCIPFVLPSTCRGMPWFFRENGVYVEVPVDGPVRVLDDALGCISHARAGVGLVQTYHFIAAPFLARGELKEVLKPLAGRSRPFSLLYPQYRHLSAKVRAFAHFFDVRV